MHHGGDAGKMFLKETLISRATEASARSTVDGSSDCLSLVMNKWRTVHSEEAYSVAEPTFCMSMQYACPVSACSAQSLVSFCYLLESDLSLKLLIHHRFPPLCLTNWSGYWPDYGFGFGCHRLISFALVPATIELLVTFTVCRCTYKYVCCLDLHVFLWQILSQQTSL